jgi:type IV pilus assembly protein PilY1
MNKLYGLIGLTLVIAALAPAGADAQTVNYTENFTTGNTTNSWYFFNGACLTAGTTPFTATTSPGSVPSCGSMTSGSGYYNLNYAAGEPLVGGTSGTIPGTDTTKGGALRFTNFPTVGSYPQGYFESGAIVSNFSFPLASQGISITFVTETYEGNSGGSGTDGADGISFFLQDASQSPDLGATGGSLAYSCSNANNDPTIRTTGVSSGHPRGYDGLTGGYIGLGIDEYGNFLNQGDNTATGFGYQWNRIGLRGAGNVSFGWLNANYAAYYPSSLNDSQRAAAVQATCQSGVVMNYNPSSGTYGSAVTLAGSHIPVKDYPALSYSLLPGVKIANESAIYRGNGTTAQSGSKYGVPISYNLQITTGGLLTLSYSYNGGAPISVISGQNITASNGSLPAAVRFGFAGSDGGSTNIHEIMCFQASPQTTSSSSASGNQKQAAPVVAGTQVYFSFYNPTNWSGSVTSDSLLVDANNNVTLSTLANWDASCVLTGVASGATCTSTGGGPASPQEGPTNTGGRTILTWSGAAGIPFEWSSLPSALQTVLDTGDSVPTPPPLTANRLNYLRGIRTGEQNSSGTSGLSYTQSGATSYVVYRDRVSVLGDVIDSSPTWVGPPSSPYPNSWLDVYNQATVTPSSMPENSSSAQTYSAFSTALGSRMNVVYAGANDGFLHGFRSGYYVNGTYQGTGSGTSFVGTENDGKELLAYMPGYTLNHIQTAVSANNYSDLGYAHQFDVDATPGTGDVFYNGNWHTLLVGGLGAGGAGIFALDITNPADSTVSSDPVFSETNAGSLVLGDWNATTLTCTHVTTNATPTAAASCGKNLGNTYGTPQIRRFHNGSWGAVFGNGFGSSTGDGGIYVMLLSSSGTATFYYLSTGTAGQTNGIGYVSTADLDGDHITDYVYAGDLLGHIWRFDLTSTDPTAWTVTSTSGGVPLPLYSTGQPITSKVAVLSFLSPPNQRVMIEFGTGQQIPLSATAATSYLTAPQALYGVWDWNFATWNSKSATQYAALPYAGVSAPTTAMMTSSMSNTSTYPTSLQVQTITTTTISGVDYRSVTSNTICWPGMTGCSGAQFGWYLPLTYGNANSTDVNLPTTPLTTTSGNPAVYEQVIYNPVLDGDTFIVNTTIPSASSLTNCFSATAGGYTMAINPATGGAFKQTVFVPPNGSQLVANGIGQSGTGSVFMVTTGSTTGTGTGGSGSGGGGGGSGGGSGSGTGVNTGPNNCGPGTKTFGITQTVSGKPVSNQMNVQCNVSGSRLTWIQRR